MLLRFLYGNRKAAEPKLCCFLQPVKEVSPSYELFDIMGKKEDRRGEEWNSGNWITGETW